MDDSADLYAGSRKNSHCTIVDVLPALVAIVGSIRGASVRHGVVRAAWGGACGLGQSVQSVTRRKQHRPGIAPNAHTTHVPSAGSSAAPTKSKRGEVGWAGVRFCTFAHRAACICSTGFGVNHTTHDRCQSLLSSLRLQCLLLPKLGTAALHLPRTRPSVTILRACRFRAAGAFSRQRIGLVVLHCRCSTRTSMLTLGNS